MAKFAVSPSSGVCTKLFLVSFKEDIFKLLPFLFNFIQIAGIKSIILAFVVGNCSKTAAGRTRARAPAVLVVSVIK